MPSTFLGITIGESGLSASQVAQDVTGHNITNANTPGYTVEQVNLQAASSVNPPDSFSGTLPGGQIGTGVQVGSVTRAQSQFLDSQFRQSNGDLGSQTAQYNSLQQIEQTYGEPSSNGLNAALTNFYQSFNNLANNPEDLGVRSTVIQSGVTLTNTFQSIGSQLDSIGTQLSQQVASDMQSITSYASQIATLNAQIRSSNVAGQQPNDLLDQRGLLLDKLSSLANINTSNNADGTINVAIGTTDLVVGVYTNPVTVAGMQARGDLTGGDLGGVVAAQTIEQNNKTALNNLAASVSSQVNAVHSAGAGLDGTTGLNFFNVTTGNEAESITVNPTLVGNPSKLAAAQVPTGGGPPPPGDATVATEIGNLQNTALTSGPLTGLTTTAFYQQTVSTIGGQTATAKIAMGAAQAGVTQMTNQRDSITGVSTDTELSNMLIYQKAYQASAQFIKTESSMLDTLITGMMQ